MKRVVRRMERQTKAANKSDILCLPTFNLPSFREQKQQKRVTVDWSYLNSINSAFIFNRTTQSSVYYHNGLIARMPRFSSWINNTGKDESAGAWKIVPTPQGKWSPTRSEFTRIIFSESREGRDGLSDVFATSSAVPKIIIKCACDTERSMLYTFSRLNLRRRKIAIKSHKNCYYSA